MKRLQLIATVVLGLAVAGCQTTASPPNPVTPSSVVTQVIVNAQKACGFAPTIATVTGLLNAVGYDLSSVNTVIQDICAAASQFRTRRGGPNKVYVRGVRVTGRFVT